MRIKRIVELTIILIAIAIFYIPVTLSARTWTNNKGKTMEAKLVKISLKSKSVKLKKEKSGKIINVSISKLSKMDQAYINDILHQKEKLKPANKAEQKLFWLMILALGNLPVYFLIGKVFFRGWSDFFECIRFWLTPNFISMFRGEYVEDMLAEWKLAVFLIACGLTVFAEFTLLFKYIL